MYESIRFRRQFLVTDAPIEALPDWRVIATGRYYVYSHPDLTVTSVAGAGRSVVLLGDVYDSVDPERTNEETASDLLAESNTLPSFLSRLRRCFGTYAVLLDAPQHSIVLTDARGLREVYFRTAGPGMTCGSQPHLVARCARPPAAEAADAELVTFASNELWDSRWVGDATRFEGVRHLLPNHYLDLRSRVAVRYWPTGPVPQHDLDAAVRETSTRLQASLDAITRRHSTAMAVTAGTDSRVLLAAGREVLNRIHLFVNDHHLGRNNPDIRVPQEILSSLGVPFRIYDVPDGVDEGFRSAFKESTFLASERLLPSIYNVFFEHFGHKVLILGVSEIGRTFYGHPPAKLTGHRMAYKLGYPASRYAIRECERIRPALQAAAAASGVDALALLYWEQRLGNWGATRNSESNVAVEKVDPFNSRLLYELFQGVDPKFRSYRHNPCVLFREVIRTLWPELLGWPVNPAGTVRDRVMGALEALRVFEPGKELKYKASYLRYRLGRRRSGVN